MANITTVYDPGLDPKLLVKAYKTLIPLLEIITYDTLESAIIVPEVLPECDVCPTADMILVEYDRLVLEKEKDDLKRELMLVCDQKQQDIQDYLLDYKSTPLQLIRYIDKYERAKLGEWDEATNALIIQNHEFYQANIRKFVDLIEAFRMPADDLIIAGELDKLRSLLPIVKDFGLETTMEDITALFEPAPVV